MLKWKVKTGGVVHASPAVADNTVFVGAGTRTFYAPDVATGKEKLAMQNGRRPRNLQRPCRSLSLATKTPTVG